MKKSMFVILNTLLKVRKKEVLLEDISSHTGYFILHIGIHNRSYASFSSFRHLIWWQALVL